MEVVPSNGPVAVPRESEGMQAYNTSKPMQAYDNNRPTRAYDDDKTSPRGYAQSPFATQPVYQPVDKDIDGAHKRLCGLRPVTFWLLTALIFAIVALAAVAGGLGSGMKDARDRAVFCATRPPSTTTVGTTSTATISAPAASTTTGGLFVDYAAPDPSMISTVALDCPGLDKQSYETRRNQTYSLSCFAGLFGGDLFDIAAYSYKDCIEACSSYNYWAGNATACVGALFTDKMSGNYTKDYGNCWLKDARLYTITGGPGGLSATLNT
ncbi:hypothetical protein B0A55_07825 [Friedmanniomyces simplex]|uniref:Apple domain-containing protein n=1 Tax=Friedmanniomyces simplex TaxID=329884 RepID=A0A4V5NEJ0_9PEZI|nr:hypothetical protein B0A55_07825 [Friedmanniomyces simplex]